MLIFCGLFVVAQALMGPSGAGKSTLMVRSGVAAATALRAYPATPAQQLPSSSSSRATLDCAAGRGIIHWAAAVTHQYPFTVHQLSCSCSTLAGLRSTCSSRHG